MTTFKPGTSFKEIIGMCSESRALEYLRNQFPNARWEPANAYQDNIQKVDIVGTRSDGQSLGIQVKSSRNQAFEFNRRNPGIPILIVGRNQISWY